MGYRRLENGVHGAGRGYQESDGLIDQDSAREMNRNLCLGSERALDRMVTVRP